MVDAQTDEQELGVGPDTHTYGLNIIQEVLTYTYHIFSKIAGIILGLQKGRPYPHHNLVRIRYCPHHSLSAKGTKEEVTCSASLVVRVDGLPAQNVVVGGG